MACPPAIAIAPAAGHSRWSGAPLPPALSATPSPARYPPPCGKRSAEFSSVPGRRSPCTLSSTMYHRRFMPVGSLSAEQAKITTALAKIETLPAVLHSAPEDSPANSELANCPARRAADDPFPWPESSASFDDFSQFSFSHEDANCLPTRMPRLT